MLVMFTTLAKCNMQKTVQWTHHANADFSDPFCLNINILTFSLYTLQSLECETRTLKINYTYPLRTDSKNSLLAGSAYSLTAPSLMLKPSFHSFRVTSVWDSRLELEGGPITTNWYETMGTRWTLMYHICMCNSCTLHDQIFKSETGMLWSYEDILALGKFAMY
jgi:hypothetical protein